MESKIKYSERYFERSLKRHYTKLTERGLEPDEACAIAIQLATRPGEGAQRVLDDDEEDLPTHARRPSLRAFYKAIQQAKEGEDIDKLVEQLKVLFSNPNNVLTPFVRSRSSSHKSKDRSSRHAKDPSRKHGSSSGDGAQQPPAPGSELTPEEALELELATDLPQSTSESGSASDLISSGELGPVSDAKPATSSASSSSTSRSTSPPGAAPRPESPPAAPRPTTPQRAAPRPATPPPAPPSPVPPVLPPPAPLRTAPLPVPVLQPSALASAAAVAFGPSAFDDPAAPPSAPISASSPLKRIPSSGVLAASPVRGVSNKPTAPRARTLPRSVTPEPKALSQSRNQPADPRSLTPPPPSSSSQAPHPSPRSLTPEPPSARPSSSRSHPHSHSRNPHSRSRSDPRPLTPDPSGTSASSHTRHHSDSRAEPRPGGSRPHSPGHPSGHAFYATHSRHHHHSDHSRPNSRPHTPDSRPNSRPHTPNSRPHSPDSRPNSRPNSRPHTPENPSLMTRLEGHQRFEPPARLLARHRSVPRQWSETPMADKLALPRSLSDRTRPSDSSFSAKPAANSQADPRSARTGSRFASEALLRTEPLRRVHESGSDSRPGSGSGSGSRHGGSDARPASDQQQQQQLPEKAPAVGDAKAGAGDAKAGAGEAQGQKGGSRPTVDTKAAGAEAKGGAKAESPRPIPDIQAIHDFYQALLPLSQKHKEIETLLVTGGRRMRRWVAAWAPTDRKRVPIAVVCLLNPMLENPEHHHQVTKPFIQAMAESSREVKAQLQWLLKSAPAEAFRRIVQTLQQYITLAIFAAPWRNVPPSGVQAAVRLLAVLWRSNQEVARISHTDFYNDAVNSRDCPVTVKQDHARWRATKGKEFTFCKYPFIYDPAAKTELLYCENYHQQYAEVEGAVVRAVMGGQQVLCPYLVLRVRRGRHLVPDTLEQINAAKHNHTLKKPLKVQFIGEEGVDEGGVQKELFQLLQRELFNPDYGMFTYDSTTRLHWFRPSPLNLQSEFELVGILIGLAIYNGHLLDLSFPLVLYRLLLGQAPGLQHLHELYPDVAASLKKLLAYEGDVGELCLTFEVSVEKGFGQYVGVELVAGGAEVEVTKENREEYVRLYVKHLLQGSVQRQLGAFLKGFHRMCSGDTLDFLLPEELEQLACGSRKLDMTALQRATQYEGGYSRHSKVVRWFWDIVHNELTPRQHKRLLSFMTGTERVPLKGLAALSPPPVIARAGPHSARLPTAHTCFNHLLLPDYSDRRTLRDRLRLAIDNAEGFGLI